MGEDSTNPPSRDLVRSFPCRPSSAADVRGFVRDECSGLLSQQDLDTAVLLTTELVANAMLHTDSAHIDVHIVFAQGSLQIGVRDEELASPEPSAPASEDTSGRGLQIVNHLSETWGVDYTEKGGKCVWFSIRALPPGGLFGG